MNQCGSFNYIGVYRTDKRIEDLRLISSEPLLITFQTAQYTSSVKYTPTLTSYSLNFGDGSGWSALQSNPFPISWAFATPGEYSITLTASENTNTVTVGSAN